MKWLGRTLARLKRREDGLEPESMVEMLHLLVIPSYQSFLKEFPHLGQVSVDQYDFVMTNAATTCALMGIESRRPQAFERARRSAEDGLLKLWGTDGPAAVLACSGVVNRGLQGLGVYNL